MENFIITDGNRLMRIKARTSEAALKGIMWIYSVGTVFIVFNSAGEIKTFEKVSEEKIIEKAAICSRV